jgi:hypothetical protein
MISINVKPDVGFGASPRAECRMGGAQRNPSDKVPDDTQCNRVSGRMFAKLAVVMFL